jgi:methionyl-tRNA formyltransferase
MILQVVIDNHRSWAAAHAPYLCSELDCVVRFCYDQITCGDIAVFLSCEKKIGKDILARNKHNIVIHQSDLPLGRGWSPVAWQVLEGKNQIPVTMFEVNDVFDGGDVYAKSFMVLNGTELVDDIRKEQMRVSVDMIKGFLANYPNNVCTKQVGEPTYYGKRTELSSELDINKTIAEQFSQMRIADNEKYPLFFVRNGIKYKLRIDYGA